MNFRFLETGANQAGYNMGLDEAILDHVSRGMSPPTLRFYGWSPAAVSLGYFQNVDDEVDKKACSQSGVDLVRRITGGGAVYHDVELTYSYIAPQDEVPKDILESYAQVSQGLIQGFRNIGVDAEFSPLNDIMSEGKKISGNAQTRRKRCILQHGTILLDVDVDKMFTVLKVPDEKIKDKIIKNAKERVTSVRHILNADINYSQAVTAFKEGFETGCNLELEPASPSFTEREQAQLLMQSRYNNPEWTNKR